MVFLAGFFGFHPQFLCFFTIMCLILDFPETPLPSNLHSISQLDSYAAKLGSFSCARRFAILTALAV
jgi:hypothetical protein